jgi:hypothetical protein
MSQLSIAPPQITPWTAPSFLNSWTNLGTTNQVAQYRKVGDVVQLRGSIVGGSVGTVAFTLPAGFRPPADVIVASTSANAFANIKVEASTGDVTMRTGTVPGYWSLDFQFSTVA